MPLGTVATIKKKKVAHQNRTTYEQWKTLYEQCKNTVEKKSTNWWLGKKKKNDEQYILNKPKVL